MAVLSPDEIAGCNDLELICFVNQNLTSRQEKPDGQVLWGYTTSFAPFLNAFKRWFIQNRQRLTDEGYTETHIKEALFLYETLARNTDSEYYLNRREMFSDIGVMERFLDAWMGLYHNVLVSGKIESVPEEFIMTREEAIAQAARANAAFSKRPDLQKLLADANYSFFTGRTMATAKDLLELDLNDFYTEGMPHLTASNGAIGFIEGDYIVRLANEGVTSFITNDLGSGSGATSAGIILGLSDADARLKSKISVTLNLYEGCFAFYQGLLREMVPAIKERAKSFQNISLNVNLHYGDIQAISGECVEGVQIYAANYVLHRLSDDFKRSLLGRIADRTKGQQALVIFADIYRNTSKMPNRGYFNFSWNGLLNPGNDLGLMEKMIGENGFTVIKSDRDLNQLGMVPPVILDACASAKMLEQGFLVVGYKI